MTYSYQSIVVLTGAGVSAESGVKTFRDSDGLWENHKLEDVCTPEGFIRNPTLVHRFYNARRAQLTQVLPNPAHLALAEFQRNFRGDSFTLVTQNVDNLHERAGSTSVLHMHGELTQVVCRACHGSAYWQQDVHTGSACSQCGNCGGLRPDIVWFGEIPKHMPEIEQALARCDLFVAVGTSGNVYPAAGFVQQARAYGAHTVEINLEPSAGSGIFAEHRHGPASVAVTDFFKQFV